MLLEGRVAIVSGVGPGLGRAMALALAREGAHVTVAARTKSFVDELAGEVRELGREALALPTDITDPEQAKRLPDATFQRFGRIDVLINSAASRGVYAHVVDADIEEWRRALDVNVVGTMSVCKFTAPYMIEAKRGSIVNISSRIIRQGMENRSSYSASKAGVVLFSQCLADELGPQGVRVNCVVPGHIWSDSLKEFYEMRAKMLGKTYDEVYADYTGMMALRRIPTPEEIANVVIFLASDLSSAMTGQSVDVNAGHYFH